ncbi:MAG: hypothetical protein Barrevirus43_5 [Barrevirus sp.]|uniref:Uncharacterized protein n=1 Tax=Barrevirus sp. TaxID=2487763 RepID=A0A3G4ZR29_9VIRU|nr:MAG: hypothetical protein Barrevirus43_5 [Barrevirus sp.]
MSIIISQIAISQMNPLTKSTDLTISLTSGKRLGITRQCAIESWSSFNMDQREDFIYTFYDSKVVSAQCKVTRLSDSILLVTLLINDHNLYSYEIHSATLQKEPIILRIYESQHKDKIKSISKIAVTSIECIKDISKISANCSKSILTFHVSTTNGKYKQLLHHVDWSPQHGGYYPFIVNHYNDIWYFNKKHYRIIKGHIEIINTQLNFIITVRSGKKIKKRRLIIQNIDTVLNRSIDFDQFVKSESRCFILKQDGKSEVKEVEVEKEKKIEKEIEPVYSGYQKMMMEQANYFGPALAFSENPSRSTIFISFSIHW